MMDAIYGQYCSSSDEESYEDLVQYPNTSIDTTCYVDLCSDSDDDQLDRLDAERCHNERKHQLKEERGGSEDFQIQQQQPEQQALEEVQIKLAEQQQELSTKRRAEFYPHSTVATNVSQIDSDSEQSYYHVDVENDVSTDLTPTIHSSTELPATSTGKKYALSKDCLTSEMGAFFKALRNYFIKTVNLERQKAPILVSTFNKAEERILCFLGFANNQLNLTPTPELFLRGKVIEKYITYLQEERCLSAATISNHAAALLYPAKFLHGDASPQYIGIKVIKQLRAQVSFYQRKAMIERPSSKEELETSNRWLDWSEIVKAVGLQRERMNLAKSTLAKATECANLLLLALYTHMPPSRGLEIRTLEIVPENHSITSSLLGNKNLVSLDDEGRVTFRFQNYKTVKTYGTDTTVLEPSNEISIILKDYIRIHRSKLVNQHSENFLLLNKTGKPFTSSSFSGHLKCLFFRLTCVQLSVNTLRSSFLTHAYSLGNCSDSTKDSLAAALRHSRKHAQQTYDKRTSNERKSVALSLATQFAEEQEENVDSTRTSLTNGHLSVGDFVGVLEQSSTLSDPHVLIGQIQSFLPDNQASLLWFDQTGKSGDQYAFQFEPSPWIESIDLLYQVRMTQMRKHPGIFKLNTSPKSIHKALCRNQN